MIRLKVSINYVFLVCNLRLSTFLLLTATLLQIFIKNKLSSVGCSNSFGIGLALSGAERSKSEIQLYILLCRLSILFTSGFINLLAYTDYEFFTLANDTRIQD